MLDLDLLLAEANTVAISGHINPDGDCVGSCLATYNYIKENYPEVAVDIYLDAIPNKFRFLRYANEIDSDRKEEINYDLFIANDCGDIDRLGDSKKYFDAAKKTINIDHHISNPLYGDYHYVVPSASSTSELIFQLLPKQKISKNIAECLYLGIIHDTGVFQYSCTHKSTMEAAGFLMECGIDYPKIVDETYYIKTFEQQKIYGLALSKCKLHLNGACISTYLTQKEMEEYQVSAKHLDGISSLIRSTRGVEVAIFLYETREHVYKASLRSAKYVDVSQIAAKHSGGGHMRAAGATLEGKPEDMIALLVNEISELI